MRQSASRSKLQLPRHASVEAGLQAILEPCLAGIEACHGRVLRDKDVEDLHQMRVGVRRLRCALKLFKRVAPCPADLAKDIAWLGDTLGDARDWDVLSTSTLAPLADEPEAAAQLARLRALLRDPLQQRHARVEHALLSERYSAMLRRLHAWIKGAQWRDGQAHSDACPLDQPLRQFAGHTLAGARRRMLKRGHTLPKAASKADADTLHRLRAAVKQSRYAAFFFATLYRPKRISRYLDALTDLQDELGRRNDLAVADRLLRQLALEQPDDMAAAAFARGFLQGRLAGGSVKLGKRWRAVRALKPPGR